MSEISHLPDWRQSDLGTLAQIVLGGTPSTGIPAYWGGPIPWMSSGDVHKKIIDDVPGRITSLGLKSSNARLVGPPSVAVALAGQGKTRGTVAFVRAEISTNQSVALLRPIDEHLDARYLYYDLDHRYDELRNRSMGDGRAGLSGGVLARVRIALPPLGEQRRIAEILSALDDQIRLTENAASKLRATFVGLLCHLLTCGTQSDIAFSGDAVLESSNTSIRLPKRWTIEPIGQLLAPVDPAMRSGPFGSALLKHELVESGVPLLGIDNVHVNRFVADFQRFVTPAKAAELSRYRVRPADVMITIMGTVGRSCLVPEDIGLALSSKHVWTLTFDDGRYRPYLASLQLNHAPWARAHLRRDEQGGIMSAIRSDTLKSLMLPTPPIDEQLEIEAILKAAESEIANHEQSVAKLRALKAGLAEDLLTGRVRVPIEASS